MSKPMTNYNERIDNLLTELRSGTINFDDKAKQSITEWHEIEKSEVYNSGCADTAKHILALFDNQIPEQLKQWLRLEIEDRGKF